VPLRGGGQAACPGRLYSIARCTNAGLEVVTAYGLKLGAAAICVFAPARSTVPRPGTRISCQITHLPRTLRPILWLIGTVRALAFGCTLLVWYGIGRPHFCADRGGEQNGGSAEFGSR
jgi:hypothetical protein